MWMNLETSLHTSEKAYGKFLEALLIAIAFTTALWIVFGIEAYFGMNFVQYSLYPQRWANIYGILTMPFIHGDLGHLLSNTPAIFVLSLLCSLMYRNIFWRVSLMMLLLSGLWTWLIARESYHVGASGMVYAYASFIFFAGIFSRNFKMLAISMLVVFLYGGLIWGIFPLEQQVSWEAHLTGFAAGLVGSFYYRDRLPKRKKFNWEEEPEEEDNENDDDAYWKTPEDKTQTEINYIYLNKKSEKDVP